MHEQQGETTSEVREISLRHWVQLPSEILRQVLIMVFLRIFVKPSAYEYHPDLLTLFRKALRRSCTDLPSYFLNLPRFSWNDLSSRARQS